jgi:hypothetical protein
MREGTTLMSDDPFEAPERRPAYSWKGATIGTILDGIVVEAPREIQARDYESGEPAFWDKAGTQPKMTVIVGLKLRDGSEYTLWCPKPSAIFAAVAQAQKDAGERINEGGRLRVKYTGEKKNPDKPKLNPQKQFAAKYDPPDAFAEPNIKPEPEPEPETTTADDEFGDDNTPF